MSRGDKVTYGGAPPKLDLNCIDNPQVLGDAINYLFEVFVDVNGGGYIPDATEAASEPVSNPARRLVRFVTTTSVSSGQATAKAIQADGSQTAIDSPTFTINDTLGNYEGAGSGKTGWAMYNEYPDDTYILEIISLGGEGTVTGSSDDELVKVTSNDAAAGYLFDQIDTWGGAPTYNASNHQPVWFDEQNDGGAETVRAFTSKVSTTQTHEVLVSAADTTESYLYPAFSADCRETTAYDAASHQRIYVRIDNASSNETLVAYAKRSEDTGRVKCSSVDTLDYLNDQFADTGAYDANRDILVTRDTTNDPASSTRLFATEGKTLLAKLDADIPARSGTSMGASDADISLFTASAATLSEVLTNQTVYNPARVVLHVYDELYVPVTKVGSSWVLKTTELPQVAGWEPSTELHIRQCSSDTEPEFAAEAPLTGIRVTGATRLLEERDDCNGWETVHTGEAC